MAAHFEGKPQVEWLGDGRNVKLLTEIKFFDPSNTCWDVPTGAVVDGASIPRIFWPIVGGPFEGKYRDASIIHDWYCDRRTRTWQATHRVFYDAMIASGVADSKAKVMYFAVRWRGPRWEERVTINTNLPWLSGLLAPIIGSGGLMGSIVLSGFPKNIVITAVRNVSSPAENLSEAKQLENFSKTMKEIEDNSYSLHKIDTIADGLESDSPA
jgi:hypothetical protein